jgi:predicted DNA-binding transcriptional regulator YafY
VDFGKRNLQHMNKIKSSGENKSIVELKYKDSSGNISTRFVEPYKLDGNDFWGYDPEKNSIRRFKIKNIKSIKPTKNTFKPRWDIEVGKLANRMDVIMEKLASNIDILSEAFKKKLTLRLPK